MQLEQDAKIKELTEELERFRKNEQDRADIFEKVSANVLTLVQKADTMLKVASKKAEINVWDMP